MAKKRKLKKMKIINLIISIILLLLIIVNSYLIIRNDVLPMKYLATFILVVDVIPILLIFLMNKKNIIKPIKLFSLIICIIYTIVLCFSFFYLNKTFNFLDSINDNLIQKEDYYIKVLDNSNIKSIEDLKNKKVGIYKNSRYDELVKKIMEKVSVEKIEYQDPIELFSDLQDKKIDAIVVNDTILGLLQTELSYLNLSLKNIDTISIPLKNKTEDIVKIVDVTNTPFNIYVAGGDAYGSIDKVMNTDVNMIVSINPNNHKIFLTSIPRDYYVRLPGQGENAYDKLTHAGYYGIEESVLAVENLLDIDINYYAKINFSTIEKVVDAIDGIDIYNPSAFTSSDRETHFKQGNIHLNGHQALMYARERKSFKDGDVQRVKNQQKVLEAIINKMTSSRTIISSYTKILDSISDSFSTNIDSKSISRIVKLQLNEMPKWEIESQNLTGFDGSSKCYSIPGMELYVMKQDSESVEASKTKIKDFIEK